MTQGCPLPDPSDNLTGPCLGKSSVLVNYEQFHHNPTSPGIDEVVFRAFPVSSQFLFTARPSE